MEGLSSDKFSKWLINASEVEWNKNKVLGTGSYGTVYKGKCRGKDVAVKRLSRQVRPKNLQDLLAEVDTMSQLLHPNVLLFMGVCAELGNLMIVTELMHGSVESILQKRKDLTTYKCISFAKDAALGLNWLHCSTPPIIHRDIKLQNLLVDDNLRVKVCDFGFAMYLSGDWSKEEAKGSPLYMAPECLKNQPFNDKSDIYSFGLVLWELYTRDMLFPDIESEEQLVKEVADKRKRPPIPAHCPRSLKSLMERCWDHDQTKRPSFNEILHELDHIMVDVAIDDEEGSKFWKQHFLTKELVDWIKFAVAFSDDVGLKSNGTEFECLRVFLDLPPYHTTGKISVQQFGNFLKWFGPMDSSARFMKNMSRVILTKGFHLKASKQDSEVLLAHKPVGTYLLRLSSEPGSFGLSCVNGKENAVLHFRIRYKPGTGFMFDDKVFESLDQFVEAVRQPYGLREVLESEVDLLAAPKSSGYADKFYPGK